MMWDFGFDNDEEDDDAIDEWIRYLEDTFDLGKCQKLLKFRNHGIEIFILIDNLSMFDFFRFLPPLQNQKV